MIRPDVRISGFDSQAEMHEIPLAKTTKAFEAGTGSREVVKENMNALKLWAHCPPAPSSGPAPWEQLGRPD